jgi:hypothetical protein
MRSCDPLKNAGDPCRWQYTLFRAGASTFGPHSGAVRSGPLSRGIPSAEHGGSSSSRALQPSGDGIIGVVVGSVLGIMGERAIGEAGSGS